MISNAFKSAYQNEVAQQNQGINTITSGIKDTGTLLAGVLGFSGALGDGMAAKAAKHTLAGRIGGVGGNIMLASLDEKANTLTNKQMNQVMSGISDNPINNLAKKELMTVFEKMRGGNKNDRDR